MMHKSIRWRLAASFAGIALLAALVLGAVLLAIVRGYYAQQERLYLEGNASALSHRLANLMASDAPVSVFQAEVEVFAFLSRVRVRFFDSAGQMVADSGAPESFQAVPGTGQMEEGNPALIVLSRSLEGPARSLDAVFVSRPVTETNQPVAGKVIRQIFTSPVQSSEGVMVKDTFTVSVAPAQFAVPVQDTTFGLYMGSGAPPSSVTGARSNQSIHVTFQDDEKQLGSVELSEGPAYGQEIVAGVARGWAVSGAVAVLLAAAAGWMVSRRISAPIWALADVTARMANGDLAARSDVCRQDEFGTLACSFNRMADRVEDTVLTLRRFVSDAAHEIHTPLTALRTNLELAAQDDFIRQAQIQVDRLAELTQSMLDLSRIESCSNSGSLNPIDLVSLVQEVGEQYASRAEQAELVFEVVLPEAPVFVQGHESQLHRSLANLLDNACKFTPRGGQVSIGARPEGEYIQIWVEDTGIGIPAEDLPHLFSRFHRGRNAAAYPGSGLGLTIVKAIVEGHGGTVGAKNTPRGTRFTVRLPLYTVRE